MRELKFRLRVGNKIIAYQKFNEEDGRLNTWFLEWDKEQLWRAGDCAPNIHEKIDRDQFTGLHDKNGVEIYEGDIVRCNDLFQTAAVTGDICWDYEKITWVAQDTRYREPEYLSELVKRTSLEVIGNIHQNPEPIKESK